MAEPAREQLDSTQFIFVVYNPVFGTITTGHQASSVAAVFKPRFRSVVKHK
jgi:hypothetical protein